MKDSMRQIIDDSDGFCFVFGVKDESIYHQRYRMRHTTENCEDMQKVVNLLLNIAIRDRDWYRENMVSSSTVKVEKMDKDNDTVAL